MAELQWVIEVRCVNALLAEIKTGERGEHLVVNVPNRNFDPSEFDKLIEGLEVTCGIEEENRKKNSSKQIEGSTPSEVLPEYVEVVDNRDLVEIRILGTGEIVNVNIPDRILAPSETRKLIRDFKAVKQKMMELRKTHP